jgi:hypothetical protein
VTGVPSLNLAKKPLLLLTLSLQGRDVSAVFFFREGWERDQTINKVVNQRKECIIRELVGNAWGLHRAR